MASSLSMRRLPVALARCQPRVISTSKRLNSTSAPQTQNPAYPLYPSVTQLLHEKGIPESEISKIPASGPKGRLLKGDVLAYLGTIPADYPSTQAARISKLAHLDLSNIKIMAPVQPAEPVAAAVEKPIARPPPTTSVTISISLAAVLSVQKKIQDTLGVTVPLLTFLARATDLANDNLPRLAHETRSADELFDEILGAQPVNTSRGEYTPELNAVEAPVRAVQGRQRKEDIIDILSGNVAKKAVTTVSESAETAANVFSLTVPVTEEVRAKIFLDRVKTLLTVEPGRLVL
ncbi:pyruvate dehydrogenase complex component Pdx1 [Aspergillus heteromorphus CBS 117.55]|uniref:Pyruvate dehydrogenase complex component Pdx1 n=1 Tax=Aspergillus heteromorphus CBS 117.55 TaxID=1448321 RepID=A0A317W4N1_9EURO|nr:pyruvate dehydrogenase complex component Pdx1 [Aspergillus heteromorphus CBS 117.55]PWY80521.1 pyruvate dehydrogenase complex component Pdx1 [Aspergillus heteromorphus CBS 117.55]